MSDHDPLLNGRAADRTDRTSHAYKLGRCIGALEAIQRFARLRTRTDPEWATVEDTAANCLQAIGHEVKP